ncbi:hypothetical protein KRR38_16470 [Novosphingobium sp. G106]|uniref:hypothetical protein n=1 Tax=Novosphingobium sp. G106 TaxID=2849500 RepID=UPI001C2CE7CD|nr:hypothetical protein [Novosphingobium sp. G106]MBV1689223.1 hypothetical protein [Novosphingobium sp. G106]
MNLEFFNTTHDTNSIPASGKRIRPLGTPPPSSRRHPSPEMRRQAAIAYAAALEVLG